MTSKQRSSPRVIHRLKELLETFAAIASALGVPRNYVTRFRRQGFINEVWALDVRELKLRDQFGPITAYDILLETREARRIKFAE